MFSINYIDWASDLVTDTEEALREDILGQVRDQGIRRQPEITVHTMHGPGGGWPAVTLTFDRLQDLVTCAQAFLTDDWLEGE